MDMTNPQLQSSPQGQTSREAVPLKAHGTGTSWNKMSPIYNSITPPSSHNGANFCLAHYTKSSGFQPCQYEDLLPEPSLIFLSVPLPAWLACTECELELIIPFPWNKMSPILYNSPQGHQGLGRIKHPAWDAKCQSGLSLPIFADSALNHRVVGCSQKHLPIGNFFFLDFCPK